jgi:hypothetical protein
LNDQLSPDESVSLPEQLFKRHIVIVEDTTVARLTIDDILAEMEAEELDD